jgi:hypothetical protein
MKDKKNDLNSFSRGGIGTVSFGIYHVEFYEKTVVWIFDMAAKRRKKHKSKISGFVISMGYEIEIREF